VRPNASNLARTAAVVQRLAVLLAAGVAPAAAWGYLREGDLPERIAARVHTGADIPESIRDEAATLPASDALPWRGLAAAWCVATDAGAPLAPTLRQFAKSIRDLAQSQREITIALAAPVATARLVVALPPVGMLFGLVLGFNTIGTLFTTPIGWACLVIGTALLLAAAIWNRKLVRSAQPRDLTPGIEFDLTAIAVAGGGALDRARASVDQAMRRFGIERVAEDDGVLAVLELSRRAGVPAADLLRSEADERRRVARAEVQRRAQELAIRLMLPLGVCVLPAFMILGVVPLLVAVVASTSIG
jgi:tight adherence protein B